MVSDFLRKEIKDLLMRLYPGCAGADFEIMPDDRFGDYTTNAAMVLAANTGKNPREVAEAIVGELSKSGNFSEIVLKAEIAGPGFINFFLADEAIKNELEELRTALNGGFEFLSGRKMNLEFISANPTGGLHIGHGRGAFFGDALANVFSFAGAEVTREFYINDSRESKQINELGKTALGEGEQYKTPELEKIISENDFSGLNETEAGFKLAGLIQEKNKEFIEDKLKIRFDEWYSEDEKLRASLLNDRTLVALKTKDLTYEKDGAVWLKTSEHGDDEDRVVIRSDGAKSYFLSDISYHGDKFARGYDEVINVWGADHHGHVKRMQAVKKMLGWKREFKIFITQLVSLKENGVSAKMSKRAGNVVLLEDLVDEFGLDIVRWFFSEKTLNTHMEFDMALAREHSAKNPVFYVEYAHARICSILEKCKELSPNENKTELLAEKSARALAVKIIQLGDTIRGIADDCQVHKLTTYAYELANAFSKFYDSVRVIEGDKYNPAALALAKATKETLAKSLGLLGISAPDHM